MKRKAIIILTLLLILILSSYFQSQCIAQEANANKGENHKEISDNLNKKVLDIKKFLEAAKNKSIKPPLKKISDEELRALKIKLLNKYSEQIKMQNFLTMNKKQVFS